jgi:hypothetical protein
MWEVLEGLRVLGCHAVVWKLLILSLRDYIYNIMLLLSFGVLETFVGCPSRFLSPYHSIQKSLHYIQILFFETS